MPNTICPSCGAEIWVHVDSPPLEYQPPAPLDWPRRVRKIGGSFQHTGTVVAQFTTLAGEPRIVMEFDQPIAGMLHIYRPDQVEDAND